MGVALKSFFTTPGVFCYLPDKKVNFEQKSLSAGLEKPEIVTQVEVWAII